MSDSTSNLDLVIQSQASKEITINAALDAASPATLYGRRQSTTSGLRFGFYGGRYHSTLIGNDTLLLIANKINYVVARKTTGAVSQAVIKANWNDQAAYVRLYAVTTNATTIASFEDHRQAIHSLLGGLAGQVLCGTGDDVAPAWAYRRLPQTSASADYTLVAADASNHLLHPSGDLKARTFTLPANASVAFAIGTEITFINQDGAGELTIAITSDVMHLAGSGDTGNRTLAANGIAKALKITASEWLISGSGLS